MAAYLRGISEDDITYTTEGFKMSGSLVRVCTGVIGYEDIPLDRCYSGVEGDMARYSDADSLEFIVEDIFGGGPSIQDISLEIGNAWVAELGA